ncbi:MAG: 3'-5' exonuclease [Candidatus Moranbacteria bacterium]|nr:3'-5' exonuclease [Candidatus Moranbacteria bacterium]
MSKIIVDIETSGFDFESFDEKSQEYLLKYAGSDDEREDIKSKLALFPLTGEIVTIGMLNPDTMKGTSLFQNGGNAPESFEEDGILYESGTEKEILEKFWDKVKNYSQLVTFNGRGFDAPFLIMRSAVHKVSPAKNLMGYRYDAREHCDLLDQLTFYGATRRFSLDFYAKSFGIKSSKEEGVDGSMVGEMYRSGKYLDIARYCVRDLLTTKELYERWNEYIRF